jgi:hypothetical protein
MDQPLAGLVAHSVAHWAISAQAALLVAVGQHLGAGDLLPVVFCSALARPVVLATAAALAELVRNFWV